MVSKSRFCLALLLQLFCGLSFAQSSSRVLVVANQENSESVALAHYYMNARHIPASNLLLLTWDEAEKADSCSLLQFQSMIAAPVSHKIAALGNIDYIVLCRNLPIKIRETRGSVDSALTTGSTDIAINSYYAQTGWFTSRKFRMRLVTRLDGWSWADARDLVDNAMAAKSGGTFYFHPDPARDGINNYGFYNESMRRSAKFIQGHTSANSLITTIVANDNGYVIPNYSIAGYSGWGSNDSRYRGIEFKKLIFQPGALAELAVSTSGSNIRFPGGSQVQSSLLVQQGVTGIKGYVAEPNVSSCALPSILFPYYVAGYNLAEAFYAASAYVGWKDVVIGDPLCTPYSPGGHHN